MNEIKRLHTVIKMKSDNVSQFERMMNWEEGEVERLGILMNRERLIQVLEKFCDINPRWLLFGDEFYFGDANKGLLQKVAFLANIERYLCVMTDEERQKYSEAICIPEYTDFAVLLIPEWENRLNNVK